MTSKKDVDAEYLSEVHFYWLVMSRNYIERHGSDGKKWPVSLKRRRDDSRCKKDAVITEKVHILEIRPENDCNYIRIDSDYSIDQGTFFPAGQ